MNVPGFCGGRYKQDLCLDSSHWHFEETNWHIRNSEVNDICVDSSYHLTPIIQDGGMSRIESRVSGSGLDAGVGPGMTGVKGGHMCINYLENQRAGTRLQPHLHLVLTKTAISPSMF